MKPSDSTGEVLRSPQAVSLPAQHSSRRSASRAPCVQASRPQTWGHSSSECRADTARRLPAQLRRIRGGRAVTRSPGGSRPRARGRRIFCVRLTRSVSKENIPAPGCDCHPQPLHTSSTPHFPFKAGADGVLKTDRSHGSWSFLKSKFTETHKPPQSSTTTALHVSGQGQTRVFYCQQHKNQPRHHLRAEGTQQHIEIKEGSAPQGRTQPR